MLWECSLRDASNLSGKLFLSTERKEDCPRLYLGGVIILDFMQFTVKVPTDALIPWIQRWHKYPWSPHSWLVDRDFFVCIYLLSDSFIQTYWQVLASLYHLYALSPYSFCLAFSFCHFLSIKHFCYIPDKLVKLRFSSGKWFDSYQISHSVWICSPFLYERPPYSQGHSSAGTHLPSRFSYSPSAQTQPDSHLVGIW